MISGLYETPLFVENLDVSIAFYRDVLGLQQCHVDENRKLAFFWMGRPKDAMPGLWEKPMVFAWMPAVAIYFRDPDGHELEFIAILDGIARPELGVIPYDEWQALSFPSA